MLLKYLNELDSAVADAKAHPDGVHVERCVECAETLEDYLEGQMAPVKAKGEELMQALWPASFGQLPRASHSMRL